MCIYYTPNIVYKSESYLWISEIYLSSLTSHIVHISNIHMYTTRTLTSPHGKPREAKKTVTLITLCTLCILLLMFQRHFCLHTRKYHFHVTHHLCADFTTKAWPNKNVNRISRMCNTCIPYTGDRVRYFRIWYGIQEPEEIHKGLLNMGRCYVCCIEVVCVIYAKNYNFKIETNYWLDGFHNSASSKEKTNKAITWMNQHHQLNYLYMLSDRNVCRFSVWYRRRSSTYFHVEWYSDFRQFTNTNITLWSITDLGTQL